MKSKLFSALFLISVVNVVQCNKPETWSPSVFRQMMENNTQIFGDFIRNKTTAVGDAITNYVDKAQRHTRQIKRGISDFIEDKTVQFDNTVSEYIERARDAGNDLANTMNIFKNDGDYDPDVDLSSPQIIARHGYPIESHTIKTEDGYLLTLHRIPRGKEPSAGKRQPVLLHHGLLGSSADWIISGPGKSLAYILADAGYDVWLGNVRGNTYSRGHVNLSTNDMAYWNFTWHEVGYYDLPAVIDFINDHTKSEGNLLYIGHSMGTTILFVLLSTRPEYNNKLRAGFALAPVTFMTTIKSPIRLLAPYANDIELIARFLGRGEYLPQNFVLKWLARFGCEINNFEEKICESSIFIISGFDEKQFNRSMLPVILSHSPAGASTKSLAHYAQEIHAKGKFQMYDYGKDGNMLEYGTKTPPEYPLDKFTLPIALFSSSNDWLSSPVDAKKLYDKLSNPIEFYEVPLPEFNHIDFLWGTDAPTLVYQRLSELMLQYKPKESISWSFGNGGIRFSWSGSFKK